VDRLQCDYLDAFILHRPDPLMDPAEVADTFAEMKETGLARQFGVSNFPAAQVHALQQYWQDPLLCNQIQFSLGHSALLSQLTDTNTHRENNDISLDGLWALFLRTEMSLQAWGSLHQGMFSNGPLPQHSPAESALAALVAQLAHSYQTNPSAIMLAWLFELPVDMQPVIGTTNPDRIRECMEAVNILLSRDDWYQLWITARGSRLP
jgi:predicted oxidoreductase